MHLKYLLSLAMQALDTEPPQAIRDYCHPFYSPYYHLMYLLAKESAYALCVECGVESGRGSFSMLLGGARVIGIDNNPDRKDVLKDNENFQMIIGTSTDVPQADMLHNPAIPRTRSCQDSHRHSATVH